MMLEGFFLFTPFRVNTLQYYSPQILYGHLLMDKFTVVGIITLLLIFLSALLAIFLVTVKTTNKLANRILGCYFLIFSLHISVFIYARYIELPFVLERLRDQIMFLSSPLLYLYLLAAIYSDFKLQKKQLLHLLPFLLDVLIFSPRFYFVSTSQRQLFMQDFGNTTEAQLSAIFAACVSAFYLMLMFRELKHYKQVLAEHYAQQNSFNFKWLFQLTILLSVIFMISQVKQVYVFLGNDLEVLNLARIVLTLLLLIFLTWIVFKSLYTPSLFRNIDQKHLVVKQFIQEQGNSTSSAQAENITTAITTLRAFMTMHEPYLDASLTLNQLATQMGIPQRNLSILINHQLQQHFFDFVNEYRINKAKALLGNTSSTKMTVQQIMYEVGFNSKSSFYTEFKKRTSQTPSQYRKSKN